MRNWTGKKINESSWQMERRICAEDKDEIATKAQTHGGGCYALISQAQNYVNTCQQWNEFAAIQ